MHVALANGRERAARLLVELGADWSQEVLFHPYGNRISTVADEDVAGIFDDTLWDIPHNHHRQPLSLTAGPRTNDSDDEVLLHSAMSTMQTDTALFTNNQSYQHHHHRDLFLPDATLGREYVDNSRGYRKLATLGSSLGMSHGATGLRIAAANAMLPFLAWLVSRGDSLGDDGGELFDADLPEDLRFGALSYAAHSNAGDRVYRDGEKTEAEGRIRNGARRTGDDGHHLEIDEDIRSGRRVQLDSALFTADRHSGNKEEEEEDNTTIEERQKGVVHLNAVVACLLALGVRWLDEPADVRLEVVMHARRWGNHALADILGGLELAPPLDVGSHLPS